ncbi:MAG: hypothetical protein GOV00_00740 [Candidatus Altiarchaeota archaeon]|nr:hypothetical protein [Candidatus Altiarchaeota archaeon]
MTDESPIDNSGVDKLYSLSSEAEVSEGKEASMYDMDFSFLDRKAILGILMNDLLDRENIGRTKKYGRARKFIYGILRNQFEDISAEKETQPKIWHFRIADRILSGIHESDLYVNPEKHLPNPVIYERMKQDLRDGKAVFTLTKGSAYVTRQYMKDLFGLEEDSVDRELYKDIIVLGTEFRFEEREDNGSLPYRLLSKVRRNGNGKTNGSEPYTVIAGLNRNDIATEHFWNGRPKPELFELIANGGFDGSRYKFTSYWGDTSAEDAPANSPHPAKFYHVDRHTAEITEFDLYPERKLVNAPDVKYVDVEVAAAD